MCNLLIIPVSFNWICSLSCFIKIYSKFNGVIYTISIDLSAWVFKDGNDDHEFVIPSQIIIDTGKFLVLCQDTGITTVFVELGADVVIDFGAGDGVTLSDTVLTDFTADDFLI